MKITKLSHAYQFSGFKPLAYVKEMPGFTKAVIVPLKRTCPKKKDQNARIVPAAEPVGMTTKQSWCEISPADICVCIWNLKYGAYLVRSAVW